MPRLSPEVVRLGAALDAGRFSGRSDESFARDLFRKAPRGLSARQAEWVTKLLDRLDVVRGPATPTATFEVGGVMALFNTAVGHGLKYPKVRLATDDGTRVVLARAGSKSRYTGAVMVTDGGRYPGNRFFGRINPTGEFFPGHALTPGVSTLLASLSADPASVARAYGHLTGNCCFCGLDLSTPESVSCGYGPVCAGKFGLPWEIRTEALPVEIHTTARKEAPALPRFYVEAPDTPAPVAAAPAAPAPTFLLTIKDPAVLAAVGSRES